VLYVRLDMIVVFSATVKSVAGFHGDNHILAVSGSINNLPYPTRQHRLQSQVRPGIPNLGVDGGVDLFIGA